MAVATTLLSALLVAALPAPTTLADPRATAATVAAGARPVPLPPASARAPLATPRTASPAAAPAAPTATALWARGYSVLPAPQKVDLAAGDVSMDGFALAAGAHRSGIAARTLLREIEARFAMKPRAPGGGRPTVALAVAPGTVRTGKGDAIDRQAYRLAISPRRIEISANAAQGLFYGVETLVQLLRPDARGNPTLPLGTIEDWPALELRFLHFDTKHHQDRPETLRQYIDRAAELKANMIGFELDDKFAYPSLPLVGAPGAFTPAELQALVDYGLERFVEVVPQIQAPAHMAYVLKHAEFAHLRQDGMNYQACMCDEDALKVIFTLYDDVIRATKGGSHFFASTDEVYFAGGCGKCEKKTDKTQPPTLESRSLAWVEFVNRAHAFLKQRGRRMLAWVEHPMLAQHAALLPPDLIDAIIGGGDDLIRTENARGIRQLAYVSMQGNELLFPDYFDVGRHPRTAARLAAGRIADAYAAIAAGKVWKGNPIGVFGAAWDDAGLHPETLWLGRGVVAAWAWQPGVPLPEQAAAEFMRMTYGPRVTGLVDTHREVQRLARFWQGSWDRETSKVRGPSYGSSKGKGKAGPRMDLTLSLPALPALPDLAAKTGFAARYKDRIDDAARVALDADRTIDSLSENLARAERNRHGLEVLLAVARFARQHCRALMGLATVEGQFADAARLHKAGKFTEAVGALVAARGAAARIDREARYVFEALRATYEKSQYPKGRTDLGRPFLHMMDDVKDHTADRRPDLTFMTEPHESLRLDAWAKSLGDLIRAYARQQNLPVKALDEGPMDD